MKGKEARYKATGLCGTETNNQHLQKAGGLAVTELLCW